MPKTERVCPLVIQYPKRKLLPTVLEGTCSLYPAFYEDRIQGWGERWFCKKTGKELGCGMRHEIPNWCPLPDAPLEKGNA